MDAQKIRRRMTLEQKAAFCSGLDFRSEEHTSELQSRRII